jgi:hypothetical protein
MEEHRPIKTFRDGAVAASIWLRKTTAGVFYDVTFSRSWKNKDTGRSGYSLAFSDRHLDSLIMVIAEARAWIAETKANAETVTIGCEEEKVAAAANEL